MCFLPLVGRDKETETATTVAATKTKQRRDVAQTSLCSMHKCTATLDYNAELFLRFGTDERRVERYRVRLVIWLYDKVTQFCPSSLSKQHLKAGWSPFRMERSIFFLFFFLNLPPMIETVKAAHLS